MKINVLEYLEETAEKFPDKFVFVDSSNSITYNNLVNLAQAIGSHLAIKLDSLNKLPIAVLIERNISSLISFFGVVYSGNFYVPMDTQLPIHRIELMIKTLNPKIIIALKKDSELINKLNYDGNVIYYEDAVTAYARTDILNAILRVSIDTDPLYAIFTSGSTGIPKGALISHRSVIDLVEQFMYTFGFSSESVFGNQAPFDFDVSVKDIYLTIISGATMVIIPKKLFSFPGELIKYLNANKINTAIWATSVLRIIANLKALNGEIPIYLKKIMFSGEMMPNKILNYWRTYLPEIQYVNLYGPTEITCNCTYFIIDRPFLDTEMLPIGIPFSNSDVFLLNEQNRLASGDEIGEICVRGSSLALGYYNNPEATSKAFCLNPLNPFYSELIYRTGDIGKYNNRNELLILARKDHQIKHMGHRIELNEIELSVNALHFVDIACCIHDPATDKIILFYQSPQKVDKDILIALRDVLPKYMLPNSFVHLLDMPLNKNAKIDRLKLKSEYIDGSSI